MKNENEKAEQVFDCLAVTNVQVFPLKEAVGHVKGLATVTLNDQLVIRGLRILDGADGLFVGYPVDPFFKGEKNRYIIFPTTCQLKEHIENCILEKYHAIMEA